MKVMLGSLAFVAIIATVAPQPNLFERSCQAWFGRQWSDATPARAINADNLFEYLVTKQPHYSGLHFLLLSTRGPVEDLEPEMDEKCEHDVGIEIINEERSITFCRPRVIVFTADESTTDVTLQITFTGINAGAPKCRLDIPIHGIPSQEISTDRYYAAEENYFYFIDIDAIQDLHVGMEVPFQFDWFEAIVSNGVITKGIDPNTGLEVFESRPILMANIALIFLSAILESDFEE